VATAHSAAAVVLGAATVILLGVPALVADGERLLHWSDLLLVALAIGVAVWLRRQRSDYEKAATVPTTAKLVARASVIRRHAAWGAPYLLFALLVASATPDIFGLGLVSGVFAVDLALEARYAARWEARSGDRLYRSRDRWSRWRPEIYRLPLS
jgi:hypothetical protein